MKNLRKIFLSCLVIAAMVLLLSKTSFATVFNIDVSLTSAQEVPPTPSTGLGHLTGTYDDVSNVLSFTVQFTGLTTPAVAAHFHAPAAAGVNAGVIIPLAGFPAATFGSYSNSYTLTADQETQLFCGLIYINIHTSPFPGGEIRGQLKEPAPGAFDISLYGAQEVPPNPSPALGNIAGTYNPATNTLSFALQFTGLVAPTTAAHFHAPAAPGVNAGVAIPLAGFPTGVTSGSYANSYVLTDVQEAQLLAGLMYLNVHTTAYPGGEIRAQMVETGNLPGNCTTCPTVSNRLYVDSSVAVSGTGGGWNCAMKELSEAIAYANTHAEIKSIWVANGTYKPTTTTNRAATMNINRADLQIIGGFAGGETNPAASNPQANPTIISGEIGAAGVGDNSYHLLRIMNVPFNASPLLISGFVLIQGNANVAGAGNNYGGAVLLYNVNAGTTVKFYSCLFGQNNAVQGGAIYLDHANTEFELCVFGANTASMNGGAIFSFLSSNKFHRSMFALNTTGGSGGAYYTNFGSSEFRKVAFSANSAAGANGGGGVYQNSANCIYHNAVFDGNSGAMGGGIFQHNASNSTIVNSTFFNNAASGHGGAIAVGLNGSTTSVENSIFWKNKRAGQDNLANGDIWNIFGTGGNVYKNNILQTNTAIPADNGTNIVNNLRGADPMFTNESNPAGPDIFFGTADDGLQLQAGSPAVNSGDNAAATAAGLTQDILDNPRIACTTVDKGAYERQDCALPLITQKPIITTPEMAASELLRSSGVVTNPFSHELQIRYTGGEKCSAMVYTAAGRRIWGTGNVAQGITRVSTTNWSGGLYEIVLQTATGKQLSFRAVKY
jgi:hypothetical protein